MCFPHRCLPRPRTEQRGVVLVVVLLIGLAGLLRSADTSGLMVGNLAFRRDLTNRAEEAIAAAKATLASSSFDPTNDALTTAHYSSSRLANGNTGVPTVLDSGYSSTIGSDTTDSSVSGDTSITYRYVIDRQCNASGAFSTSTCEYIAYSTTSNGTSGAANCNGSNCAIYRISVRVAGPRNTVAYFQTTYVN